jgi:hypothetical protein
MLYEQCIKMDFPPVLLVDLRPAEKFLLLFVFDNDVAEQVTRASKQFSTSMPKHPRILELAPLAGARSLVTTDVSSALPGLALVKIKRALHHLVRIYVGQS